MVLFLTQSTLVPWTELSRKSRRRRWTSRLHMLTRKKSFRRTLKLRSSRLKASRRSFLKIDRLKRRWPCSRRWWMEWMKMIRWSNILTNKLVMRNRKGISIRGRWKKRSRRRLISWKRKRNARWGSLKIGTLACLIGVNRSRRRRTLWWKVSAGRRKIWWKRNLRNSSVRFLRIWIRLMLMPCLKSINVNSWWWMKRLGWNRRGRWRWCARRRLERVKSLLELNLSVNSRWLKSKSKRQSNLKEQDF